MEFFQNSFIDNILSYEITKILFLNKKNLVLLINYYHIGWKYNVIFNNNTVFLKKDTLINL